jgi:hypothetical protein
MAQKKTANSDNSTARGVNIATRFTRQATSACREALVGAEASTASSRGRLVKLAPVAGDVRTCATRLGLQCGDKA